MRQLDLFGFTQEESLPAVKEQVEETPAIATTKAEKAAEKVKTEEAKPIIEEEAAATAFVQASLIDSIEEVVSPSTPPAPQDNIVFSDNNIKVKIKVKAVKAPPVVEEALDKTPVQVESIVENTIEAETAASDKPTAEEVIEPASTISAIVTNEVSIPADEIPEEIVAAETEPALTEETTPAIAITEPIVEEVTEIKEEPVVTEAPKKPMTTVIKPEENKIMATVAPKPVTPRKTPPPAVSKKRGRKSFKEIDAEVDLVNVPDDDALFQKQYYPISTVATWFNVNTSLLRYWENEFDILKPRKNRKGDRLFRPEDVKTLQTIYYLLRQRKFTIEGAKEYLKSNKRKVDLNAQLVQSLTRFRSFLLELKANL